MADVVLPALEEYGSLEKVCTVIDMALIFPFDLANSHQL
jgi:hypothetical protein